MHEYESVRRTQRGGQCFMRDDKVQGQLNSLSDQVTGLALLVSAHCVKHTSTLLPGKDNKIHL